MHINAKELKKFVALALQTNIVKLLNWYQSIDTDHGKTFDIDTWKALHRRLAGQYYPTSTTPYVLRFWKPHERQI